MSNDPAVGGWFSELAKVFDSLALLASWAATAEQAGELTGSDKPGGSMAICAQSFLGI